MIPSFISVRIPQIYFGPGRFSDLDKIVGETGKTVLVLTGVHSLGSSGKLDVLIKALKDRAIKYFHFTVKGEPSPDLVDRAVCEFGDKNIDVVLSIGGGSVIDAGKAISAMLLQSTSVLDYLEGVGKGILHNGVKVPFIAVPTTSGTGTEATKNAVLSRVGTDGFKRSLRHDNIVPDIALVDPELTLSCPPDITAASGMDAFTQLLESYVSSQATPLTDALAYSGLGSLKDNLVLVSTTGGNNIAARTSMAYASLISGMTLASAGLGIVHGLASAIGGLFSIPHGVVCGTLVGAATEVNIKSLKEMNSAGNTVLRKYAKVGSLLEGSHSEDIDYCCGVLTRKIAEWTEVLRLPLLSEFGIKASDVDRIISRTGNKNNPVKLNENEIKELVLRRI